MNYGVRRRDGTGSWEYARKANTIQDQNPFRVTEWTADKDTAKRYTMHTATTVARYNGAQAVNLGGR